MEKEVTGVIKWTTPQAGFKQDGVTPYVKVSCKVDGEWIGFFFDNKEQCDKHLEAYPNGVTIKATLWKKDTEKYWKLKKDHFNIIEAVKQESTPQMVQTNQNPETKDNYWRNKDARDELMQPKHIMVRSIESACKLFNCDLNNLSKANLDKIPDLVNIVLSVADDFFHKTYTAKEIQEYPIVEKEIKAGEVPKTE